MIDRFDGQYAFLSNFEDCPFVVEGITYPTVEHFFQAQKTLDLTERKRIANAETPGQAKRMGRRVSLRADWESEKDNIMYFGLTRKFSNPTLKEKLLSTGSEKLVEGNWWHDEYWGRCNGVGKNKLGKMLMHLREILKEQD